MAILLLSQGVPMILSGDEVLRSQQGNNNCYCQDNELSWFDWNLTQKNAGMLRFTREMIRLRRRHPSLMRRHFLKDRINPRTGLPEITWHGARLHQPPWNDPGARLLAFTLFRIQPDEEDLHIILNMEQHAQRVDLPQVAGRRWYLAVHTARNSPDDIMPPEQQQPWPQRQIQAVAHSVVVLESR
jgi:glycogen operon protein